MAISWRTNFPGGNGLLLATDESARRPVLRFAAEPKNCPQALWFHFRAAGLAGRGARVILANPTQTLGGEDWSGNFLVFRTPKSPWLRTARPKRLATPGGRTEWAWDIDAAGGTIEVAHCFPYQPADLEATLAELGGAFKSEFVGLTLAQEAGIRIYYSFGNLSTAHEFGGKISHGLRYQICGNQCIGVQCQKNLSPGKWKTMVECGGLARKRIPFTVKHI